MRNVSNKFLEAMRTRRDFYAVADILFANGERKTLSKRDFAISGNSVVESAESSSFPLGILAAKRITISLENGDERWSEYDFYGAKIFLQTKFDLDDGTTETLNMGTFTVVTPENYGTTVVITAIDDSYKTDVDYSTALPYPMTAGVALKDSCDTCGITLKTLNFTNSSYVIPTAPEKLTHRQFIGMIAMLAGGNAVLDEYNRLMIKPYDFAEFEKDGLDGGIFDAGTPKYQTGDSADGGSFVPWITGYAADGGQFGDRYNINMLYDFKSGITIGVDDVVITGVQITSEDAEGNKNNHLYGQEGYVLSVENRLASGKEDEAVRLIGKAIVGLRFRPFSGDHVAYPLAEFMDLAYLFDRNGNICRTVLTDVNFTYYGFTNLKCTADSPIRNRSTYYGNETKTFVQARKMIEKEKTDRERAIEELAKELAQSSGLFMTAEVQEDRSTIYYMHDKPALEESRVVWKMTANAFGISTDGGITYPYGLDASGTAILNRIYAIGINANYINAGTFEIVKNGKTIVLMNKDTGQVILRPDIFELSSGATIDSIAEGKANNALNSAKDYADTAASNAVNGQTQTDIFKKLTDGGKAKGIILKDGQLYVAASYVDAEILSAISTNLGTVTAGILQSENYAYAGGNFAQSGFYLNLSSGLLRSKQLFIGSDGNTFYSGILNAPTINGGSVVGSDIVTYDSGGGYCELCNAEIQIGAGYGYPQGKDIYGSIKATASGGYGITFKVKDIIFLGDPSSSFYYVMSRDGWLHRAEHEFEGNVTISKTLTVDGEFHAYGAKTRVVNTTFYQDRLLYCYEMPSPMFGDIGEAVTDENGECCIYLDDVFSETVSAQIEYQVFLQKEGPGDIWIVEKTPQYFVVKGTENLKFAWEIKAKQKGYEYERMEIYTGNPEEATIDYEQEYLDEIEALIKEQEAMLYEAA